MKRVKVIIAICAISIVVFGANCAYQNSLSNRYAYQIQMEVSRAAQDYWHRYKKWPATYDVLKSEMRSDFADHVTILTESVNATFLFKNLQENRLEITVNMVSRNRIVKFSLVPKSFELPADWYEGTLKDKPR